MPVPETVVKYIVDGIEGAPSVMKSVLGHLGPNDPRWDARPDPERFTLREMVAHVADWDPIFLGRVEKMKSESNPMLESVDEGALAIEHGYSNQDPVANLDRLAASRPKLVSALRSVSPEDWDRTGHRQFVGDVSLFQLATMIIGHDAYHLRQAAAFVGELKGL